MDDVTHFTKAGGGCGRCKGEIQKILDKVNGVNEASNAPKTFAQMTLVEKIRKIEQVLESDVLPMLNMDGGSAELVDLNGTVVKVRLVGMCSGCTGAAGTLKHVIEKALQEKVDPSLTVEQA